MVGQFPSAVRLLAARGMLVAQAEAEKPLLLRLDPPTRAQVLMVLVGLVLVGALLMAIVFLAGRHVRRNLRKPAERPREVTPWYQKPLASERAEPKRDAQ